MEPEPEAEPEPFPGAGALIKSEAPKKAPDGPKMGGSGEKAPAPAPEHCTKYPNMMDCGYLYHWNSISYF